LQAFRDAFSVVLATVVYLPSVNVLALVPLAGSLRQVGSAGALLDFDQEAGAVVLKADKYYVEGDVVRVCDSMSRPNGELLLSCGLVDDVRTPPSPLALSCRAEWPFARSRRIKHDCVVTHHKARSRHTFGVRADSSTNAPPTRRRTTPTAWSGRRA
jgi:hypothetical protein